VRDLSRIAGVTRVRPGAKLPKLLLVDYNPAVVAAQSLVALARRRWTAARLRRLHRPRRQAGVLVEQERQP